MFKLHSFVDIITNSSTVVYTQATNETISIFKEIVNLLLKNDGSTLTADDMFKFSIEYDADRVDDWRDDVIWDECEGDKSKFSVLRSEYEQNPPDWWNDYKPRYDEYCNKYLKVSAINDDETTKKIAKLFERVIVSYKKEGIYDG